MKQLTIEQIKSVANRGVIESFTANVVKVYKPTDPSPAQANAGIHKQGIVVADQNDKLSITLNSKEIHMDENCEGKTFTFQCGTGEAGQATGMTLNRWMKGNEEKIGVDVWPQASFAVNQNSPPAATNKLPAAQEIPSGHPADPMEGVDNYFGFHRAVFDKICQHYFDTGVSDDANKESATHYCIGLQQRGKLGESIAAWKAHSLKSSPIQCADLKLKDEEVDADAVRREEVKPVDEANGGQGAELQIEKDVPWQEVQDSNGNVISQMEKDDLIDLCIKLIPFSHSSNPVIQKGFEAAMRARDAMELTFATIYDVLEVMLAQDHEMEAISAAYSKIEGDPSSDSEAACKNILMDQKLFIEIIENQEKQEA